MKSEWRVTSNYIGDKKMYSVYKIKDANKTDHSGNREYIGGWTDNRGTAAIVAAELNKGGTYESNKNNNL